VSFGPVRQTLRSADLAPNALVVAIDYATSVHAEVARDAQLFLVDERGQFEANRAAGVFEGYLDPHATIGLALRDGISGPAVGRILVSHLGVGLADLVFGEAIVQNAITAGLGLSLPR
ncbi:MAG: hypothetical protein ACRDGI_08265, partial [Candidatus Limnocylindrales bacterium]